MSTRFEQIARTQCHQNCLELKRGEILNENGNILHTSIFKYYDTNHDRVLSDEEYEVYASDVKRAEERKQEFAKVKIKDNIVSKYEKKLLKLERKYDELNKEFENIDTDAFAKLMAFENAHPGVEREVYKNKSDIPKDAIKVDISAFGMGVFDSEKNAFTGEIEKTGYLVGLDTLSKEEREEYLQLFDYVNKVLNKLEELQEKQAKYNAEYDKAYALKDMAESGVITTNLSSEAEASAYSSYVQIRNESNPFYREIKELEQERISLCLQAVQTAETAAKIEQCTIRIQQLYQASAEWSIKDAKEVPEVDNTSGFRVNDWSETATYTHSGNSDSLTDSHSLQAGLNLKNFSSYASFTKAEKYGLNNGSFENTYEGSLAGNYKYKGLSINLNSMLSADKSSFIYNQSADANFTYKKVAFGINENVNYMKIDMGEESQEVTTVTTTPSVTLSTGKVTTTASAAFCPKNGDTYSLNSSANLNIGKVGINPSAGVSYNEKGKTFTVAPAVSANYSYRNKKGFSFRANAMELYRATMQHGSKPKLNHNFTGTSNIGYKRVRLNLKFNDSDSPDDHSNTYGAGMQYETPGAGTFGVDYSYMKTKNKKDPKSVNETSTVSVTYSLPLDWLNKKK